MLKFAMLFSMLFQIVATIIAISLIRRTRFNISWILISCAFILMALRRLFEFSGLFWESKLFPKDEINGWIGVLISVFIFVGVIFIKKIFNLQDEIEKLRTENENKVLSAIINTEEKARQLFARELHDGMGPVLSSIKMTLSAVNHENLTPVNRKIIESAHHAASNSIITLKEIANNLSPHLLTNYGLKQALETLASQLFPQKNIGYEFDFQIEEKQLSEEMSINLYRILSELINNSFVHANPQNVYIEIKEKGAIVHVRYMDDGVGFEYDSGNEKVKNNGMGLNNIFSRTKSLNGHYSIVTAPENGFLIEFFFPLNNKNHEKN